MWATLESTFRLFDVRIYRERADFPSASATSVFLACLPCNLQFGLKIGEALNPAGLAEPMFIKYPRYSRLHLDKEPRFKSLRDRETVCEANFLRSASFVRVSILDVIFRID